MNDKERIEKLTSLVREVMRWHSDPESADYNQCDKYPCYWCEMARKAMADGERV